MQLSLSLSCPLEPFDVTEPLGKGGRWEGRGTGRRETETMGEREREAGERREGECGERRGGSQEDALAAAEKGWSVPEPLAVCGWPGIDLG